MGSVPQAIAAVSLPPEPLFVEDDEFFADDEDDNSAEHTGNFSPAGSPLNVMEVDYIDLPGLVDFDEIEAPGSPTNVDLADLVALATYGTPEPHNPEHAGAPQVIITIMSYIY